MSLKKTFSTVLASALIMSYVLPAISYAETDTSNEDSSNVDSSLSSDDSYYSTKKIEKFLSWENKVLSFMTRDYKKVVAGIQDTAAQRAYTKEFVDIRDDVKNIFSDAQESSDYMFEIHVANLKKEIGVYKAFRKELVSLEGTSVNPFSVVPTETTSVESDMIDFQKAVTSAVRKAIDNYKSSEFKETGKMNMEAEGGFGKVSVSIEKYTSLLSLLKRAQEVDVTAKVKFAINTGRTYEYNETTDEYEETKGTVVSGDMAIDGNIKIIDKDMYLTLRDYTITTDLTGEKKETFEKNIQEWAKYKGKTVKIPLSSSMQNEKFNQAEFIAQVEKVLAILEEKSLFTPYKKIGNIYTLTIKGDTVEAIRNVFGQKTDQEELAQVKKNMRKDPLFYSVMEGKKMLFININEDEAKGMVSLTNLSGKYSFLVDVGNPKEPSTALHLLIEKDFVEGKLQSPELNMDLSYKNKVLILTGENNGQKGRIEGPLSSENTNLTFTLNDKKIGNVTWSKVADTYTYDILFEMTIEEMLSKFHINGESTITKGSFPIETPKDFIEVKLPEDDSVIDDVSNL